ncbi:hypothetical protein BVG16_29750 [Paenibacillus selenitireducens]|uniref:Accessory regulator AgrB n=1 Tax=Paenibacillus selenitireducens TaxID=1324314 RepID=A0A1T2X0C2_9BACL|nr:accessory gene regulator B family protein [Paenibacillus selenitireducens]OPA73265.1 hypothetical protein BVG16_29750 [Paenibacillus selenitireducens]
MVYYLAGLLTRWMMRKDVDGVYDEEHIDIGNKVIVNFILIVLLTLVISLWANTFWATLAAALGLCMIRKYSGGHHLPSSDLCVLYTSLIFVASPWIAGYFMSDYVVWVDVITLFLTLSLSPFGTKFDFIRPQHLKLKLLSCIPIVLNLLFFHWNAVSVAMLIQGLHLFTSEEKTYG